MTLSGRDFRVAVAALVLAALPGCKQILGLHDRSEGAQNDGGPPIYKPVAGQCGSLRHQSASCAACMDQNCCTEATACHADPACDPAFDCNTNCGDDATCRARCITFFTRSDSLIDVTACRESHCKTECGLSCGGFGYNAPGCSSCIKETCCSIAGECAKNGDCVKLDLCKVNCLGGGTSSCPTECEDLFPGGMDNHRDWRDCAENVCSDECTSGHNWSCLDARPAWFKPKSAGLMTFSVTIVDILTEKPFAGATVKACGKLDKDCAMPIDTQMTNADGRVSLTVSAGSVGFDGYVDMTGGNNGEGGHNGEIFPAIWYPSPNIVSAGWRGRVQFVSYGSLGLLAAFTGATIDPTRGHFAAAAQDCNFAAAGGVTFDADTKDDGTTVFYFIKGLPKTDAMQTDSQSGIGGYINCRRPVDLDYRARDRGGRVQNRRIGVVRHSPRNVHDDVAPADTAIKQHRSTRRDRFARVAGATLARLLRFSSDYFKGLRIEHSFRRKCEGACLALIGKLREVCHEYHGWNRSTFERFPAMRKNRFTCSRDGGARFPAAARFFAARRCVSAAGSRCVSAAGNGARFAAGPGSAVRSRRVVRRSVGGTRGRRV